MAASKKEVHFKVMKFMMVDVTNRHNRQKILSFGIEDAADNSPDTDKQSFCQVDNLGDEEPDLGQRMHGQCQTPLGNLDLILAWWHWTGESDRAKEHTYRRIKHTEMWMLEKYNGDRVDPLNVHIITPYTRGDEDD